MYAKVSGTISSLTEGTFTSLRYSSIGHQVFSLEDGLPIQNFTCSDLLDLLYKVFRIQGSPTMAVLSITGSPHLKLRAAPLSLAIRNLIDFFPPGTKMFQFSGVLHKSGDINIGFPFGNPLVLACVLAHGAYRKLPPSSPLMPRHSPLALNCGISSLKVNSLFFEIIYCSFADCSFIERLII